MSRRIQPPIVSVPAVPDCLAVHVASVASLRQCSVQAFVMFAGEALCYLAFRMLTCYEARKRQ